MVGSELDARAVRSTACEAGTHAATPQSLGPVAGQFEQHHEMYQIVRGYQHWKKGAEDRNGYIER
jgi:hypothetical protein